MRVSILLTGLAILSAATLMARAQTTRPAPERLLKVGRLIKVDGSALVIQPAWQPEDAAPIIVPTDETTSVLVDMDRRTLSDLKPEVEVTIRREAPTEREPNPKLYVHAWSPGLSGVVVRVDSNRVVLNVPKPEGNGKEVVVETNQKTKVQTAFPGGSFAPDQGVIGVDEIKPGMWAKVVPAEGVARKIFVSLPRSRDTATTQPVK